MCTELYPPLSFHLSVHGTTGLNCRIEHRNAFNIFGVGTDLIQDETSLVDQMETFKLCGLGFNLNDFLIRMKGSMFF